MKARSLVLLSAALFCVVALVCCGPKPRDQELVGVENPHPEIDVAVSSARDQLPLFWEVYEKRARGETGFAILIRLSDLQGEEEFWMTDLKHRPPLAFGVITEVPKIVNLVKKDHVVELTDDLIRDWRYERDGKVVGDFILRAKLGEMSTEEAALHRAQLAEANTLPSCPPGCEVRQYFLKKPPFDLPEKNHELKKDFVEYGIPFEKGGFAYYLTGTKRLVISATPAELEKVDPENLRQKDWQPDAAVKVEPAKPGEAPPKLDELPMALPGLDLPPPELDPKQRILPSPELKN